LFQNCAPAKPELARETEKSYLGAAKGSEFMGAKMRIGIIGAACMSATAAFAADTAESVRLANDVVPAPFGYETIATRYVVAEPTALYISPYIYPGLVNNTPAEARPGRGESRQGQRL
jgi:hypothetical protein